MAGYHVPVLHNHCQFVVKMSTTTPPVPSLILVEYIVKVIFTLLEFMFLLIGRHGSDSRLCRDEREKKMAATYNVLAFKR